ncbi:MAG: 50S ribosomal protein L24 [Nanoarchaeota archaeon]
MKMFSPSWKSSTQRRKQRKYQKNAPLHVKQKFIAAHLSKELRKKYKRRALTLRKGYTVKIMRGQFKKQTGRIMSVNLRKSRITIEGMQHVKRDGTKTFYPIHPSNVQIIELITEDKQTRAKLEGAKK